jgi:hypothetical protein
MIDISSLPKKIKVKYNKLIAQYKSEGKDESTAISEAIKQLKAEGSIKSKEYISFRDYIKEEGIDVTGDGVIDNEDIVLGLELIEPETRLEEDLIEILLVSAEHGLISVDMIDGIFELIGDHADLSDEGEPEDVQEEIQGCSIEEVRAKALIKKKGGKRRVRCTSGPNKGKIRIAGQCGKKVDIRLSRKLKRVKKRQKSKLKLAARKGARTAKRRGTRR